MQERTSSKRHCMVNGVKVNHTVGTCMAPGLGIVNGYVMLKKCPEKVLQKIRDDFGDFLTVIVTDKGGMDGSRHISFFLDQVFTRTAGILRREWGRSNDVLLCLDNLG